jgi:hypothetical protein
VKMTQGTAIVSVTDQSKNQFMKKMIIAGCLLLGLNAAFAANDNGPVNTKQATVQTQNFQDSSYQRRKYPDSTGRGKSMQNNNSNWKKGSKMKGHKGMSDSSHRGMSGTDSTKQ